MRAPSSHGPGLASKPTSRRHDAVALELAGDAHAGRLGEAEPLIAAEEPLVDGHHGDGAVVVAVDARAVLREVPLLLLDAHVALIVGGAEHPVPDAAGVAARGIAGPCLGGRGGACARRDAGATGAANDGGGDGSQGQEVTLHQDLPGETSVRDLAFIISRTSLGQPKFSFVKVGFGHRFRTSNDNFRYQGREYQAASWRNAASS